MEILNNILSFLVNLTPVIAIIIAVISILITVRLEKSRTRPYLVIYYDHIPDSMQIDSMDNCSKNNFKNKTKFIYLENFGNSYAKINKITSNKELKGDFLSIFLDIATLNDSIIAPKQQIKIIDEITDDLCDKNICDISIEYEDENKKKYTGKFYLKLKNEY